MSTPGQIVIGVIILLVVFFFLSQVFHVRTIKKTTITKIWTPSQSKVTVDFDGIRYEGTGVIHLKSKNGEITINDKPLKDGLPDGVAATKL